MVITMKKTIFAVSDIHGHYTELMEALADAGFDENNEAHIFLSCGDLFDRGRENLRVYEFVKGLKRKILLRGNHEDMLADILRRGYLIRPDYENEMNITVRELLGEGAVDADGHFDGAAHATRIAEVLALIDSMGDYYEAGAYVFTHGWLPIVFEGRTPRVDPDWRQASAEAWLEAHLLEWQQLYSVRATLEGRTIVCGHRPSRLGYTFDPMREPDCCTPFAGEGLIVIDAGTVRSGRVHVLTVEK